MGGDSCFKPLVQTFYNEFQIAGSHLTEIQIQLLSYAELSRETFY